MANPTTIPAGFLGLNLDDIVGGVVDQVTGILPDPIADAIKSVTNVILDPHDDSINIGDPQPEGERPIPTTEPEELNAAVKAIDSVLAGIAMILKFGFIIPDNIEEVLRKVSGALGTIRGWLD